MTHLTSFSLAGHPAVVSKGEARRHLGRARLLGSVAGGGGGGPRVRGPGAAHAPPGRGSHVVGPLATALRRRKNPPGTGGGGWVGGSVSGRRGGGL